LYFLSRAAIAEPFGSILLISRPFNPGYLFNRQALNWFRPAKENPVGLTQRGTNFQIMRFTSGIQNRKDY
jgi:hypothetical protein